MGGDARGFAYKWVVSANCVASTSKSWDRLRASFLFTFPKLFPRREGLILPERNDSYVYKKFLSTRPR